MTPPHAYIPGQTPRHPEDLFDPVKSSVRRGMSPEDLAVSEAWQTGLHYYRTGYFWEAHEVLEAVWLATGPNSVERRMVQAVIQLSNAALKARMGRTNATRRLCNIAAAHLAEIPRHRAQVLGLSPEWVLGEAARLRGATRMSQYNANLDVGGV